MKVVQPIVNQKRGSDFRPSLFYVKNRIRISIDDFESDDRWANKRSTVDEERENEEKLSIEEKLFIPRLFGFVVSTESQHSAERHVVRGVQ